MLKVGIMEAEQKMLKGINKQIIEIKCPESEHFEKILLFVKSDNGSVPVNHLGAEIYEYYSRIVGNDTPQVKKGRRDIFNARFFAVSAIIASGLLGLLAVSLIL